MYVEDVDLTRIGDQVGTPCFVYSRAAIAERSRAFDSAFAHHPHLVCYAVKANSNLAVLNLLARLGSGFDIVSGGELARVLKAGGDPQKIVFSGIGKTATEIGAALRAGIYCFNVESEAELELLNKLAGEHGMRAPVSLRVNPDVDASTHPYIATGLKENKFGIDIGQALDVYRRARGLPHLSIQGVGCHIGSQLTDMKPFLAAVERIAILVSELGREGARLQHLDLGGGLGIRYDDEDPPEPAAYVQTLLTALAKAGPYESLQILIEPGRAIVGNAGVLLTRVLYLKPTPTRNFAIVDAAMNDLIRPALYDAWHDIAPVAVDAPRSLRVYDVVGPVCESADFLGRERELGIEAGDLLVVASAGAYGFCMSSNYNTRARAAEVLVDGGQFHVVRRRETLAELLAGESVPPM